MAKYQVLISFRGEDTRATFVSHLHSRLRQKKVATFIDDRLEKGEEVWPELQSAIEASEVVVVVFSENYASSSWCLDELVNILRCKESGQVVVPVFYRVDPAHVRKQSGSYRAALARFEGRFEEEVLRKWRDSLTAATKIIGWDSKLYRVESEFLDAIVEDILQRLSKASSSNNDSKDLIGIDQTVEQVNSLLSIHTPKVLTVGIWAMGGMGKTTLARFVFKKMSSQFEGCCFLANVREEFEKQTSDELKQRLVSELLEENDQNTRDAEVLRDRADEIFEVKGLNFDNAFELFCLNAFKRSALTTDDIRISKKVVNYVGGIPLALKILGSFLRSKRREKWDHELDKLKEVPNKKIHNVLKKSFDGLDKMEQSIFLDFACCIKGHVSRYSVECIVGGGDSFADIGIDSLIDKSLISVEGNALVMHDLVREMGQEIVRQQYVEEPGKCSRIWGADDASYFFKHYTGTAEIEGISIDWGKSISEVELSPILFKGMYKLRLLNLEMYSYAVKLPQGLQYLPDTLTCLVWPSWPLKYIPTCFEPHKLVVLKMQLSNLEQLWSGVHDLANLTYIDLSNSSNLTELPDLSLALNLESVDLSDCRSLRRFRSPLRFRVVDNVASLNQCHHKCNDTYCWTLGSLNLKRCSRLEIVPEISGTVKEFSCGSGEELIFSRKKLESKQKINSSTLLFLFPTLAPLSSLHQCSSSQFLYEIGHLASLEKLTLSDSGFTNLPENINQLHSLVELNMRNCRYLKSLPALPLSLQFLKASRCVSLEKISDSSSELTRRWGNNNSPKRKEFLYYNCLKLDQNMCNTIVTEFQIRSLHTAAISASKHNELKVTDYAHVNVCCPGKKIPKWFDRQSEARSLDVALSSSWHDDGFLGVAVCAVVAGGVISSFDKARGLSCTICVRTKQGESFSFTWEFTEFFSKSSPCLMYGYGKSSGNLFMWYKYENNLKWRDAAELSLKFDMRASFIDIRCCGIGF